MCETSSRWDMYWVTEDMPMMRHAMKQAGLAGLLLMFGAWLAGCTAVNTFPLAARSGDTISVMIGGSEQARKETLSATLTDAAGGVWDLQALGKVRSVFNLRADGRAHGMHYSSYLDSYISWSNGHEPVQTVLVADLPTGLSPGNATLTVGLGVTDNSSGAPDPSSIQLEILPGSGSSNNFSRRSGGGTTTPADLQALEPAPHAKLTFGNGSIIGAVALIIDVDQSVVNLDDLNVYVPESTVRGSFVDPGAFGDKQRMVYWRQDGDRLYIDVIAPQGIDSRYLQMFVMHPRGLSGSPAFSITSASVYDVNGQPLAVQPQLAYSPQ